MNQNIEIRSCGVSVVILRKTGDVHQVLLLRRSGFLKGEWCQVAGNIEKGEKAWQAVLREMREETNLVPQKLFSADQCEQFYEVNRDSIWIAPIFVAFILNDQKVKINREHTEFRWVSFDEAISMVPFPGQKRMLEHIQKEFVIRSPLKWLEIDLENE